MFFDINTFVNEQITGRTTSLLATDIAQNKEALQEAIAGKSVLVIGGAGTIGSSFIKAILPFRPQSLTVVDYSENGLTELTRDLRSQTIFVPDQYITYPFDFGSEIFQKLYRANQYDIVACFAAHKHVRSEKDHLAIEAMVRNNVFNTKSLLDLAAKRPPEHLFSVSTDKAANSVNVMGASKKLMEHVLLAYGDHLKISTARFANVAFSNGSLLYGFTQRILKQQPLSAPSDVRRYFVSPVESGQLCMLACLLSQSKDIFFPKLRQEEMMTFSEIAERFLYKLNLKAEYCSSEAEAKMKAKSRKPSSSSYPVYFFKTDTSGEKSYEEFYTSSDEVLLDQFESLGIVRNQQQQPTMDVNQMIRDFELLFAQQQLSKSVVVDKIKEYVSDFAHVETGKSLDQKM
jgi:FlaA1/EpsC-like NDP-sugar epimerase